MRNIVQEVIALSRIHQQQHKQNCSYNGVGRTKVSSYGHPLYNDILIDGPRNGRTKLGILYFSRLVIRHILIKGTRPSRDDFTCVRIAKENDRRSSFTLIVQ